MTEQENINLKVVALQIAQTTQPRDLLATALPIFKWLTNENSRDNQVPKVALVPESKPVE